MICGHKTSQKRVLCSRKKLQICSEATQDTRNIFRVHAIRTNSFLLPRNKPQKFCVHIQR